MARSAFLVQYPRMNIGDSNPVTLCNASDSSFKTALIWSRIYEKRNARHEPSFAASVSGN